MSPDAWVAVVGALAGAVVGSVLTFYFTLVASRSGEQRRAKRQVLETLMRYRAHMLHADAIAAINMIDMVFIDAPEVREARRQFMDAVDRPKATLDLRKERFAKIIEAIARHLGIANKLSASDIGLSYHPTYLNKRIEVELYDNDQRWQAIPKSWFTGQPDTTPPSGNDRKGKGRT